MFDYLENDEQIVYFLLYSLCIKLEVMNECIRIKDTHVCELFNTFDGIDVKNLDQLIVKDLNTALSQYHSAIVLSKYSGQLNRKESRLRQTLNFNTCSELIVWNVNMTLFLNYAMQLFCCIFSLFFMRETMHYNSRNVGASV